MKLQGLILLQPEFVLAETGVNADSLSDFVGAIMAKLQQANEDGSLNSVVGHIVLAIRPGGRSKTWYVAKDGDHVLYDDMIASLVAELPGLDIDNGLVLFAIKLAGDAVDAGELTLPPAWNACAAAAGRDMRVDDIVNHIWP